MKSHSENEEQWLTYPDILSRARQRLTRINELELKRDVPVILCFRHRIDFVVSFWAGVLGGYVVVPLAYPALFNLQ